MSEEYLKGLTKEELINIIDEETSCTYQLKEDKELLKRENQRLKEKLKWKTEVAEISTNSYNKEKEKSALYKEVIGEVRECFENNFLESTLESFVCLRKEDYENLKDKLDKVKEQ